MTNCVPTAPTPAGLPRTPRDEFLQVARAISVGRPGPWHAFRTKGTDLQAPPTCAPSIGQPFRIGVSSPGTLGKQCGLPQRTTRGLPRCHAAVDLRRHLPVREADKRPGMNCTADPARRPEHAATGYCRHRNRLLKYLWPVRQPDLSHRELPPNLDKRQRGEEAAVHPPASSRNARRRGACTR